MATVINSGVYKILNKVTGKCYVGSSKDLNAREKQHFSMLKKNSHHSIKLQNSYNKHGSDNFAFIVLEGCEFDELLDKEQLWMDTEKSYKKGYNCSASSRYPTDNIAASVYVKNKKYIKGFIQNIEEINSLLSEDKCLPEVSFFGFGVDQCKSTNALFKRYWQASNILLWSLMEMSQLDTDKEYRLNCITYFKDGQYQLVENTAAKPRLHGKRKSRQVGALMLENLLESMQRHRYGKRVLSEYEEYKKGLEEVKIEKQN